MASSEDSSSSDQEISDNESIPNEEEENADRAAIREDLKSMTFEEILKLKEELGAKIYKEAVLGVDTKKKSGIKKSKSDFKRANKNRPREAPVKRPVPFLGAELRNSKKLNTEVRDPRFDENSGTYDTKIFKENYKFLSKIRAKEIKRMKKKIPSTADDERVELKKEIQKLANKNVEDRKWHDKQKVLKEEQEEIRKAKAEGRTPHYITKKERRAKELVKQFEDLKQKGKLNKHLEKRRKKMISKDRKKINFD